MKTIAARIALAGSMALVASVLPQASIPLAATASTLLTDLQHPPRDCTQVPFWFWNGPLDSTEFRRQLREMADKGVYAAMPHPRFGMDRRAYLEPPFWQAMAATLDEAKKLHMKIWLYDEYNWPSGGAGGRVTDGHPELYPRGLDYLKTTVSGPRSLKLSCPINLEPRMEVFEKYLAAFLRRTDDLHRTWTPWGKPGVGGQSMEGDIPAGSWEVQAFYQVLGRNPSPLDDGSNAMTDYLSEASLRRFIALTHEQYDRRFRRYFGTVIPAVFSDESSTTAPAPFPWTEDFASEFQRRRGSDIAAQFPALLEQEGKDAMRLRLAYWQTVTDLYGGRYLGQYADWCRTHGLKFTGHVFEENLASYAHAPQLFDLLRPMDFPGFDALGPVCPPHGAKPAISLAHLENRAEALCENMGLAGGWNCTLSMLRNGYNQLGWLGVSRFVPHAFFQTVENPRVECPPSLFYQNPYWKYYHAIADLSARLAFFNRLGNHVAPCLLYYPIESLWADSPGGKGQGVLPWQHKSEGNAQAAHTIRVFNNLADRLPTANWDLDVADTRLFSQASVVSGDGATRLKIGPESFSVVVVPPLSAIGKLALEKLDAFLQNGGIVLWLGRLPQLVWPHSESEPAATLQKWFLNGIPSAPIAAPVGQGKLILLPPDADAALRWLNQNVKPQLALSDSLASLRINHRRLENLDLYLLFNDSDQWLEGKIQFPANRSVVWINLDDGTPWRIEPDAQGHPITLLPRQSAAMIFGCPTVGLSLWNPQRPRGEPIDLSNHWEIQLAGEALDQVWDHKLATTRVQLPRLKMKKRSFQKWEGWTSQNYPDQDWDTVAAVRGQAMSTEPTSLLFRTVLPPGTKSICTPLPLGGEYAMWFNGSLLEKSIGPARVKPGSIELPTVSRPGDVLAIETISHAGPAGIEHPLQLQCSPVVVDRLRSWRDWEFAHYAGRVLYRKEITLERKPERIWLDLGKVEHYVEVWVNGHQAGLLLWPPYALDITSHCRTGQNEIVLIVANSIANRFAWDVWGTRGTANSEPSGLLGPVTLWKDTTAP